VETVHIVYEQNAKSYIIVTEITKHYLMKSNFGYMTKDTRAFNNYGDRKVGLPQEKFTSKTVGGKISIWDAVAPMSP